MCDLCSCSSDHIYDIIVTSICVKLVCVRVRVCARVHECARVCACACVCMWCEHAHCADACIYVDVPYYITNKLYDNFTMQITIANKNIGK